jgi:hypothetical protein
MCMQRQAPSVCTTMAPLHSFLRVLSHLLPQQARNLPLRSNTSPHDPSPSPQNLLPLHPPTVMTARRVTNRPLWSFTVKLKESMPLNPGSGEYVKDPSACMFRLPRVGRPPAKIKAPRGKSISPSGSLALDNTPLAALTVKLKPSLTMYAWSLATGSWSGTAGLQHRY